ncbi:unnamed protein product [Notodromas monacha]|uniref:Uncharacterized protein n=1 Tax=Notodromas monacha TaxID=399045 RepID=A0A7R9BQH8_9CRUS|nr:unnamed protein product [Notodromas monacha]CAG0919815.1 unnamed protein product [Notodromas monacha]
MVPRPLVLARMPNTDHQPDPSSKRRDVVVTICAGLSFTDALLRAFATSWTTYSADVAKHLQDEMEECLACTPPWSDLMLLTQVIASCMLLVGVKRRKAVDFLPWLMLTPCMLFYVFYEVLCVWAVDARFRTQRIPLKCLHNFVDLFQSASGSLPSHDDSQWLNIAKMVSYAMYSAGWVAMYLVVLQKCLSMTCGSKQPSQGSSPGRALNCRSTRTDMLESGTNDHNAESPFNKTIIVRPLFAPPAYDDVVREEQQMRSHSQNISEVVQHPGDHGDLRA